MTETYTTFHLDDDLTRTDGGCTLDFVLDPVPYCVRYRLQIDVLPSGALVKLRDTVIATGDGGTLDLDVTDWLSLDDNTLDITGESVRGVRLVQTPCE